MGKKKQMDRFRGEQLDQGTFTIYQKFGAIWKEVAWAWRAEDLTGNPDEIWILSAKYRKPGEDYDNKQMQLDWIAYDTKGQFLTYVRGRLAADATLNPATRWDHSITAKGTFS